LVVIAVEAQVGAEGGDGEPGLLGELARPRGRRDVPGRHVGVAGPLDALEAGGRGMVDDGLDVEVAEGDGAEAGSDHGGPPSGSGGMGRGGTSAESDCHPSLSVAWAYVPPHPPRTSRRKGEGDRAPAQTGGVHGDVEA